MLYSEKNNVTLRFSYSMKRHTERVKCTRGTDTFQKIRNSLQAPQFLDKF